MSLPLHVWQAHAYEVSCDLTTEGDGFIARVARHVKVCLKLNVDVNSPNPET